MSDDKNGETIGLLVHLAGTIPAMAFRGWVLAKLWLWFVMPLGAPHLSVTHALGISLVVSNFALGTSVSDIKRISEMSWWNWVVAEWGNPLIALGIGYGIHWAQS